jgi:type VI secretion system protein ImpK
MRDEIANLVHPVLTYALQLKERLERGEPCDIDNEQATLKSQLMTENEARRLADFGGDGGTDQSIAGATRMGGDPGRRTSDHFLGIRYALVCWLDEMFILDSPWSVEWNERKLEASLYGTNDRAWKFWDQARRAESRPGSDALEVFFLCVMLGFRGDLRDEPDRLEAWVAVARTRMDKGHGKEWKPPPDLGDPPTNVPPRQGREQLQRMILLGGAALLAVIPIVAFFVVRQLWE